MGVDNNNIDNEDGPVDDSRPPWKLEFRSSNGFIISVVAIAVFTDVFIYGMIVPILPIVLGSRTNVPEDELQKWMSILLAAFAGAILVGSPVCGYFADKAPSRKAPFLVGLTALGGSTMMFWFARTVYWLVIARTLQGLSCAVVWTVGLALVVDTVGKDEVGTAMGIVSMAMTVGTVSGPLIGGVVLARAGYHAVFSVAIAFIVLDIILRQVMIEKKAALKWLKPSHAETESLLNGHTGQTASQYESIGQLDQQSIDYPQEQYVDVGEPLSSGKTGSLPGIVRLLCTSSLLVVLGSTIIVAAIQSSFDTVLPLYVLRVFDWGPMEIGLCFLPLFLPAFASPKIGATIDCCGTRGVAFVGFLLDFPVLMLLQLVTENTTHDKVLLFVVLFFAGIAACLQLVSLMTEIDHIVERKEKEFPNLFGSQGCAAQAYGLLNVAWAGGQMLGPLVAGSLVDHQGWGTMVTVFGVASGVVAVVVSATSEGSVLRWKGKGGQRRA
ncbi:hypothetical protein ASPWEDRAFT_171028 [Aspergillus wentii DTO 134E9]|uniref:Major facilitator superfamily (MFS) profile domain-containing protein n=1 Tax=Aspergillus wentii DTO 134E9 TaxID=1073089 RepID=A0A1L9RRJ9_ASPWE|nr:uncharacterized protein ASPWEDRAFT_171028 [Aspergillus wentii DTO 134E9]KAI9930402.1 hypothetical protein MW887_011156 [Aspergillus wentii]OJJ37561.1 hypothetical protein ASPWEDRAFT_171028 [Aspergillus wentii DTO 134E9]